jgi:hypothetical protein
MKLSEIYKETLREAELTDIERDVQELANDLSRAIKTDLESEDNINESLDPVSILSLLMASNTLIHILSGWSAKILKKYNIGKGAEAAEKIHGFTSAIEDDFKTPIRRVISLFTKDPESQEKITDGLFVILLLSLGVKCGADAYKALMGSSVVSAGVSALKGMMKGIDIVGILKKM